MDYRYLKVFIESAGSLNFAATAQKLGIAPSAVSRQIRLFEESVGESLFIRNNRKVILTEKGQEILRLLQPIEGWSLSKKRKLFRVAGLTSALDRFFWPVVGKNNLSSEVDFQIFDVVSTDGIALLEANEVDVAFVNKKETSSLISYFSLGAEEFVLISKSKIPLNEVHLHTWIYGESGDTLKTLSKHKSGVSYIKANSVYQIYELVEKGLGIAIVPMSPSLKKRQVHIQSLSLPSKSLYLAVPNFEQPPAFLKKFYQMILDAKG